MATLGARFSNAELRAGLSRSEKVLYRENGNRSLNAATVWRRIQPVLERAGVTRLAEISQLRPKSFPVFQATRPGILLHSCTGQNTGGQGKGTTRMQAKVSCVMETIESFCMEPRDEALIRGSYRFLRRQHFVIPPWRFPRQRGMAKPGAEEPFMWTRALLPGVAEPVLVPAESVFFPFLPREYGTRPRFVSTSNGTAAGSTYLEAAIHALYELIERHYYALWNRGRIKARALRSEELDAWPHIRQFRAQMANEFSVEVLALRLPKIRNLPVFVCWLVHPQETWLYGAGCAPNFEMAINRAVSEAIQTHAVLASAAREDFDSSDEVVSLANFPATQTLSRRAWLKTAHEITFYDLQDEYRFLLRWLRRAGFPLVALANLTREGLGVPVVRAIIPGLCPQADRSYGIDLTMSEINEYRFRCRGPRH